MQLSAAALNSGGRSLTIGLCAALAVALCCLTFFLCRGGDGVAPEPDRSAQAFVRPSASPEQAAAPTDAPAEEASAPEDAASLSAQGGPSPAPSDAARAVADAACQL